MNQLAGMQTLLPRSAESIGKRLPPGATANFAAPTSARSRRGSNTSAASAVASKPAPPLGRYQPNREGGKCGGNNFDDGTRDCQADGNGVRATGGSRNTERQHTLNNGDNVEEFAADNNCRSSDQQERRYRDNEYDRQWGSYRTTANELRTPCRSANSRFNTSFSFRQTRVPEGYPKMDHERNPRRGSCVSEFSRKLAEGYDIWDDVDRPVINWKYPQLPIRENKTHELRMMANLERINRMREREKQMNKRNIRAPTGVEKKETAWWERSRNGLRNNAPGVTTPSNVPMRLRGNRSFHRPVPASNVNSHPNPVNSFRRTSSICLSSSRH